MGRLSKDQIDLHCQEISPSRFLNEARSTGQTPLPPSFGSHKLFRVVCSQKPQGVSVNQLSWMLGRFVCEHWMNCKEKREREQKQGGCGEKWPTMVREFLPLLQSLGTGGPLNPYLSLLFLKRELFRLQIQKCLVILTKTILWVFCGPFLTKI